MSMRIRRLVLESLRRPRLLNMARQFDVDGMSGQTEVWHPRVGVAPSRVSLGDLGYRWGSCGKNAVVYFNWRLLQLPVRLVDYVIVHELVDLLEHNHTREFWRIMDRVLPDWRDRKTAMESGWQSYVAFGIADGRGDAV